MDLNIRNHAVFSLFGLEIFITDTLIATWIVMGILITLALIIRVKIGKFADVPTGFQNVIEFIVESFDNYVKNTAGEKLSFLGYWFFTVFLFILFSNISGLFLLRPPTADWSVTFSLALVTFFLIHIVAIKQRGGEYLSSFLKPFFVFLPINILSELAKPISLSFRLFGNVLAGLVILTLVYSITPLITRFVFPIALHIYFDLFAGLLQTYIFVTLGLAFIASASEPVER